MANPWQMQAQPSGTFSLQDSPVPPEELAKLGMRALASGKISVKEAQANAAKIGLSPAMPKGAARAISQQPPGQADAAELTQTPAQWDPAQALAMGSQPATAQTNPLSPMIYMQQQPELQNKKENKTSLTRDIQKTPAELKAAQQLAMGYAPGSDQPDPNSPYQQSQADLKQLAAMNGDTAAANAKRSNLDLSPLLALADSQTGSKLAGSYHAPEDRSQQVMANAASIASKKGDLLAKLQEATGGKAGTVTTSQDTTVGDKTTGGNSIASTRASKLAFDAAKQFDNDPIMKQVANTHNSLKRAISIMDGKTPVTAKNFALLQQDMINAVSPGGAATEGKVNREMVTLFIGKLNDLMQKGDSIQDLRKDAPENFAQLKGLLHTIYDDYNHAGLERAKEIAANSKFIPNPVLQNTVQGKLGMLSEKFNQPVPGSEPAPQPQAGQAGKIRVKRKDGVVGTILESDFDPAKYEKVQ